MIGVEYLSYKDKKLPFRISFIAIAGFQKETKLTIAALDDIGNNIFLLEPLCYYALEAGYLYEGKKMDIRRQEVRQILDICWIDFTEKIYKFFPTDVSGKIPGSVKKK